MHEKRQQLRFSPGQPLEVKLLIRERALQGWVEDVSPNGCRIVFPTAYAGLLKPGMPLEGTIGFHCGPQRWQGPVVHRRPTRGGIGFGIRFERENSQHLTLQQAIQAASTAERAGALRLNTQGDATHIELQGFFGFGVDRDFLGLVRRHPVSAIDVSGCRHIDSAGLGLLAIAREIGIPIVGAQGRIAELLAIARLTSP